MNHTSKHQSSYFAIDIKFNNFSKMKYFYIYFIFLNFYEFVSKCIEYYYYRLKCKIKKYS